MSMNDTLQNTLTNLNTSTIIVEKLFQKILLGCLLSSLSIFTVCGNILVLYAIQTEKNLRTVSNLFILSLAFADLAVGLFVMPLSAATIIAGRWTFPSVVCKMWLSIDYVASTASIFNLVLLSLDRYWAVVYPLRYLRKRTRRRATIFILIVWFISLLWAPAVIFWSYIAPQHSDVIKKDECDTAFRLNKTFKTLTALVNFYLPLLTMIIISCRIMVAIRSRSKMELGRRLSSTTQKQMKRDRIQTIVSPVRNENQPNFKFDDINLPPTVIIDPVIADNGQRMIEPGQCFCSTCQSEDGNDSITLWQLQPNSVKNYSSSSLRNRLSLTQLKPVSTIFSSTKDFKDNMTSVSQEICQKRSDNIDQIRTSISVSNNMKYTIIVNPSEQLEKVLPSTNNKKSLERTKSQTSSVNSSFSEDFADNVFVYSNKNSCPSKTKKKATITSFTASDSSPPIKSHLKVPPTSAKDSIVTLTHHSSSDCPSQKTTNMNFFTFFNTLINPSHSSSLQKELKAARQLGMLVGVFTVSWLPYFILFLVVAWCNHCVSDTVYTASIWLGYVNSTFNPLIYPLCNVHFRRAFQKICYCQHAKTKLPNLNALRELQTLHSMSRRR